MPDFFLLDIDLTNQQYEKRNITELFSRWLGGTAVCSVLLEECGMDLEPYDPQAPIIFGIGPFSSVFPVATKTVALFRSPLTNDLGESHAGGRLAMSMYGAGYHMIRFRGVFPSLSYIVIDEDEVHFKRANSLKGMSALATERVLREREDSQFKRSIVRIGPAGERRSPIACATVDASRHFGRLGLGGVMGSKNLKAIVVSGGRYWTINDRKAMNAYYKKLYDTVVHSSTMKKYHNLGTAMNIIPMSAINGLPTRNFSQGFFESAQQISGETFARSYLSQQIACAHCQTGCIHMATLRETYHLEDNMVKTIKVSYDHELIYAWGSNLSIQSPEAVLRLLLFVEKQGWDAISMGVTVAWAVEAFQQGYITQEDTDGLILNFGDAQAYIQILERVQRGHNRFFRSLEQGAAYCASQYGGQDLCMTFGKNEAPGYMTGLFAFAGYASGVRHSHLDAAGYSIDQTILQQPMELQQANRCMYDEACWRMVLNSLGICLFARNVYAPSIISEGLSLLGFEAFDEARLISLGRSIHALKYRMKRKWGFDLTKVKLPGKLTKVMTSAGKLSEEEYRQVLDQFDKWVTEDIQRLGVQS